jgi:microcin C transport system substrate-binding protein
MIIALEPTRRQTLLLGAAALASTIARPALAREGPERHGMSAFGDLKYPPDFKHFDYVNPNAPKGGVFSHIGATRAFNQNFLTFNSLNSFILKGDGAQGMGITFASLMARATDEPDAVYGLAARAVRTSADGLTYRFLMRPGITFHDGSPLTAHDVAFSLTILKDKGHPIAQQLLRDFAGACSFTWGLTGSCTNSGALRQNAQSGAQRPSRPSAARSSRSLCASKSSRPASRWRCPQPIRTFKP